MSVSATGSFAPFCENDMTCRDYEGNKVLKSIVDYDVNELVVYMIVRQNGLMRFAIISVYPIT